MSLRHMIAIWATNQRQQDSRREDLYLAIKELTCHLPGSVYIGRPGKGEVYLVRFDISLDFDDMRFDNAFDFDDEMALKRWGATFVKALARQFQGCPAAWQFAKEIYWTDRGDAKEWSGEIYFHFPGQPIVFEHCCDPFDEEEFLGECERVWRGFAQIPEDRHG